MIRAEHIKFDYIRRDGEDNVIAVETAVNDVSFEVKPGEFVAILGHNGSGKSTLARHINALLVPEEGTMYVDGIDTSEKDMVWEIRKRAGMVFQNPDNQIVQNVVEEDVGFGPENMGVPTQEILKRVEECLKEVGMYSYRRRSPNHLSGGQKQRVAIAGIMAMRPKCIILDEATAMLDPVGRKKVLDTVHKLNRDEKITIIMITHYMEEAAEADYVVIIDDGKISAEGTPLELKNIYTGDYITIYDVDEKDIKALDVEYEQIRNGYRLSVPNTKAATELIIRNPQLFNDYEITKGKMDDVFLAVTGKTLVGGAEK